MDTGKSDTSDDSVTVCLKFQYGGRKTGSTCNSETNWDISEIPAARTRFSGTPDSFELLPALFNVGRRRI